MHAALCHLRALRPSVTVIRAAYMLKSIYAAMPCSLTLLGQPNWLALVSGTKPSCSNPNKLRDYKSIT